MKKITGQKQKKHYEKTDQETGEIINLQPEFNDMSRRPGIGKMHYEKYKNDIYKGKNSHVRVKGKKTKPPRYYDKLYQRDVPPHYEEIKRERQKQNLLQIKNNTPARLKAEEEITKAKIRSLKQKL
nr:replication associated protein [Flumine microvirus 21]